MKLVIDISEEEYAWVKRASRQTTPLDRFCVKAIAHGTPLPEHHGRLIDGDKLLEDIIRKNPVFVSETDKRKRYARLVYYWAVKNAPTIIERSDGND